MGNSTVVVTRSQVIQAPPERVWSLLSSPEAWSLRPAKFAFDVTVPEGNPLRLMLGLGGAGPICVLYETSEEVPGRTMSLQTSGTVPPGREHLSLSATPQGSGTQTTITATRLPEPGTSKSDIKAYWEVQLKIWLANLSAVIEGQSPWPDTGMSSGLRAACTPQAPLAPAAEASASALIRAPIDQVWRAVYAPESGLLIDPDHVLCAGRVPGPPVGQVGEMQYFVRRFDDGRLTATVCVVTELADQRSALTASIAPRHTEMLHLVTPTAEGTQLQLTTRWPASKVKKQVLKRQMADWIQASVDDYKRLIESAQDS